MNGYDDDRRDQQPDLLTNIDAEAALLGGMLMDNRLIVEWADRLRVDDFAEPLHGRIYSALLRFSAKNALATATLLRPIFAQDEAAGRGNYLDRLVDSPAALVGAAEFAAQILELSDRRVARAALQAAQEEMVSNFDSPILEIVGPVQSAAWAVSARQESKPIRTLADMVGLAEDRVRRVQDEGESIGHTNLLVPDMDKVIGPLEVGYHIIAGRPGMGKTTLAHSAALGYAANGAPGVYASAEMTDEQLGMRAAVDLGFALGHKIKHDDLRKAKITPQERQALIRIGERAQHIPLDYLDLRGSNIRRLWSEVARRKAYLAARGKKLGFVVVDSIGLFKADIDGREIDDDRKRVNFISAFLNAMAHALDVAIIALNQLSRGIEARVNKRPLLSDLKESGNLEQDADTVTFVYRDEYYLADLEPKRGETDAKGKDLWEEWDTDMRAVRGKVDIIGGKNRHGSKVTRTANFFGQYYAIREASVTDLGFDDPLLI